MKDGTKSWEIDAPSSMSNTAPMPLADGRVLLQTWSGSSVVEIPTTGAPRRVWNNATLMALPVPAMHVDGYIYGFGGNSAEFLTCVDATTGDTRWTSRTYRGALAVAGKTLVMQSEASGFLRLIAAEPGQYRELAKLQVLKPGATTVTPPTIAGGRIYVRNLEEIVAVTVR